MRSRDARSFCIGCEYLIRRPEYLYRVDYFLESYTYTAEAHHRAAQGSRA